jgi:hypothetical protein
VVVQGRLATTLSLLQEKDWFHVYAFIRFGELLLLVAKQQYL